MALSFVQYTGDGSNRNFGVPFPYIKRDHISVTVNGTAVAYAWLTTSTIQTATTPANGAVVEVRRQTPQTRLVDFVDGSTLSESDLDLASIQTLYLAQELGDAAVEAKEIASGVIGQADIAVADAADARARAVAAEATAQSALNNVYGALNDIQGALDGAATAAGIAQNAADTAAQAVLGAENATLAAQTAATAAAAAAATAEAVAGFDPIDYLKVVDAVTGYAPVQHGHQMAEVAGIDVALQLKADAGHGHTIGDVVNLDATLNGKAPVSHTHSISQVTNLQSQLDSKALQTHTHTISQVSGLQAELDAALPASGGLLSAGFWITAANDGSQAGLTYTPNPATSNIRRITNNGAFTLAGPTAAGDYTMVIQVSNATGAGAVSTTGWNSVSGDAFTTTAAHRFMLYISKVNGFRHLNVVRIV
jgi:hypothetical protein